MITQFSGPLQCKIHGDWKLQYLFLNKNLKAKAIVRNTRKAVFLFCHVRDANRMPQPFHLAGQLKHVLIAIKALLKGWHQLWARWGNSLYPTLPSFSSSLPHTLISKQNCLKLRLGRKKAKIITISIRYIWLYFTYLWTQLHSPNSLFIYQNWLH